MFYLKVKETQNKFSTLYNFFYGLIIGFPISVILLVVNVLYIFNEKLKNMLTEVFEQIAEKGINEVITKKNLKECYS